MPIPTTAGRTAELAPEDDAMRDWLDEEGDYVSLERGGWAVQLDRAVGFDMLEPEG